MKHLKITLTILLTLIISSSAFGQYYYNPQSTGMAQAYSTMARGGRVIGWNPANLGLKDNPNFTLNFNLLPIADALPNIYLNNSALSSNYIFKDFLTGGYMDSTYINDKILSPLDGGLNINPVIQIELLNMSIKRWAFSMGAEVMSDITLPYGLFELAFKGNDFGKPISLSGLDINAQTVITSTLAHGREVYIPYVSDYVSSLYVGGAVKFLFGIEDFQIEKWDAAVTFNDESAVLNADALAKVALFGTGFAFDLGATAVINEKMMANISFNNLFGFIKWGDMGMAPEMGKLFKDSDVSEYHFTLYRELAIDEIVDTEDGFEVIADSLLQESIAVDTLQAGASYSTPYPAYMLVGFQYSPFDKLDLAVNYRQYMSDSKYVSTTPQIAVSAVYRPARVFPLRAGFAIGGREEFMWSFGTGLNFSHYTFDIGFAQTGGFFNNATGFVFTLGQSLIF